MFVIRERTDAVVAAIPVGRGASAVAVNPKTNIIYVTNNRDSTVSVIDGHTRTVTATIPVGRVSERGRGQPGHQHRLRDELSR